MWQIYFAGAATIIVAFALLLFARAYKKSGEAEVKRQIAERGERNAEIIADIATNDKPADVRERLRNGDF